MAKNKQEVAMVRHFGYLPSSVLPKLHPVKFKIAA
jgi:hypothetical protein